MINRVWVQTIKVTMVACLSVMAPQEGQRQAAAAERTPASPELCDIQHGACTKEVADVTVTLDILPKPVKAMKDLKFQVTVSGAKRLRPAHIDLGMPGMDMGPNRVELRAVKDNLYEGEGVIVRCPSGRRTWKAVVVLPETGKVEFFFDVIS